MTDMLCFVQQHGRSLDIAAYIPQPLSTASLADTRTHDTEWTHCAVWPVATDRRHRLDRFFPVDESTYIQQHD